MVKGDLRTSNNQPPREVVVPDAIIYVENASASST